ncbi:MAG: hypothetical protein SF123_25130 [Chloroflexota bacterium]|nr:hypothetical protein [Chloroflexota bacterium]
MSFQYAQFRAEFVRLRRRQRHEQLEQQKAAYYREALIRPTELVVSVRAQAARGRLWLTPLEKRLLHYDRRYLAGRDNVRSDYLTLERARYLVRMVGCSPRDVARLLDRIDDVFLRAAILDVEVGMRVAHCLRVRRASINLWMSKKRSIREGGRTSL